MYWTFTNNPPPAVPATYNAFFIVLGIVVAMLGSYSALQFTEATVTSVLQRRSLAGNSIVINIFAASFSIATLTIWLMHYSSMISVTHQGYPILYALGETVASMLCIFICAFGAIALFCCHRTGLFGDPANHGEFIRLYESRPKDTAHILEHIIHILRQMWAGVSLRLLVCGSLVGLGVYAMHFVGMMSMRQPLLAHYYSPLVVALCAPYGAVAGSALILILFTFHGLRRRIVAAVVLGLATTSAHWLGYFSATVALAPPGAMVHDPSGEVLVDAEVCCVVVMLLSSLTRFVLMGVVYD